MQTTPYSVWRAPSGAAVVSMPGQIDRTNCGQVHAALMRAIQAGAAVVIADLTRTDFCGHAAAVTLVSAHALAAQAGTRLRVAAALPNAQLIGQVAGAGHRLDLYPDLTAALAGPRSRGPARVKAAHGHPRTLIPDAAGRRRAGKLARRLSVATSPDQAPPPGPPTSPA